MVPHSKEAIFLRCTGWHFVNRPAKKAASSLLQERTFGRRFNGSVAEARCRHAAQTAAKVIRIGFTSQNA